jgi:hypothetical protein
MYPEGRKEGRKEGLTVCDEERFSVASFVPSINNNTNPQ